VRVATERRRLAMPRRLGGGGCALQAGRTVCVCVCVCVRVCACAGINSAGRSTVDARFAARPGDDYSRSAACSSSSSGGGGGGSGGRIPGMERPTVWGVTGGGEATGSGDWTGEAGGRAADAGIGADPAPSLTA